MKTCPACQRKYDHRYQFCPFDGRALRVPIGDALLGAVIKRKYKVLRKLEEAAAETVYEAEHMVLPRKVLLRVYDERFASWLDSVQKFRGLALQTAILSHPHIAAAHEFAQLDDGRYFLAVEHVAGRLLTQVISEEAPLRQGRAIDLALQISKALKAAHDHGIHHGNLSPDYIYVYEDEDGEEQIKVYNFGVARAIADWQIELAEARSSHAPAARALAYISPEHATAGRQAVIDECDEIYGLGVLLYEMLSGELPFQAERAEDMIVAHATVEATPLGQSYPELNIRPELDALTMRALSKQRQKRPKNLLELERALEEIRGALTPRRPAYGESPRLATYDYSLRDAEREPAEGPEVAEPLDLQGERTVDPHAFEASRVGWQRSLLVAMASLLLLFVLAFAATLLYYYLKPKYGTLVIKTVPSEAEVFIDGIKIGTSPLTQDRLTVGRHKVKVVKSGYADVAQEVDIRANSTENLFISLQLEAPSQLSPEARSQIAELTRKAELAFNENILLPPPDDYNVLYFCNKILEIDPGDQFAREMKHKIAQAIGGLAEKAYAQGNWFEAEKHYKSLAMILPEDEQVKLKLDDVTAKIEELRKERANKIKELSDKVEQALRSGNLLPPASDNALDNINNILRIDSRNLFAREAKNKVRDMLRSRAEAKAANNDLEGAHSDYITLLQYFPTDREAQARLDFISAKLEEARRAEEQRRQQQERERQMRQQLRLQGIAAYRAGDYDKAISQLQEAIKSDPNNDEIFFYLAAAYLEKKQFDAAIANFERCAALNPNHTLAHLNLGVLYDIKQNYAKAEQHLIRAHELGGAASYTPDKITKMIQDVRIRAKISQLEGSPIAVEHKHIIGSCKGSLVVTASSVRYQTSEKDHAFAVGLSEVQVSIKQDSFELRLKANKRYNFRCQKKEDSQNLKLLFRKYKRILEES